MSDSQSLQLLCICMLILTAVETAVARLSERNRRGDVVYKRPRETPTELLGQFARTFFTNLLANFSLTGLLVAVISRLGRDYFTQSLKDMVWGSPLDLALLICGVLLLAFAAGLYKMLLFWKLRGDELWRARWLGLVGGVAWLWITYANIMLPNLASMT